jgi:hypothetical protein
MRKGIYDKNMINRADELSNEAEIWRALYVEN